MAARRHHRPAEAEFGISDTVDLLVEIDRSEHVLGDRSIIGWRALLPQNKACRQERQTGRTQCREVTSHSHPFFSCAPTEPVVNPSLNHRRGTTPRIQPLPPETLPAPGPLGGIQEPDGISSQLAAHHGAPSGISAAKEDALWKYETSPLFSAAERAALRFAQYSAQVPNAVG